MTPLLVAGYVFSCTAAALAWALVPRRPGHRAVALLLSLGLAVDLGQRALVSTVLGVPGPYAGGVRLAFHVQEALFIAWPAGIAGTVLAVFPRRRAWPVALGWAAALAVLVAGYPTLRGDTLRRAYLAIELAALGLAAGVFIRWTWRREGMDLTRGAALAILAVELAMLVGPYRGNVFTSWDIAQAAYTTVYAALSLIQGGSLWEQWKASRSR